METLCTYVRRTARNMVERTEADPEATTRGWGSNARGRGAWCKALRILAVGKKEKME